MMKKEKIESPKVSVIIPIYNAEKYLFKCLDSVINQSLKEIEIICVDDGSTDNCPQIIASYANRDNRIKVIHKKNGGLVSARQAGVKAATGKYIGYVDSDDWIEPNMYEVLYNHAMLNHVDLVTSGYYLEGNYTTLHLDLLSEGLYNGKKINFLRENTIYMLDKKETGLRASLCCKLFLAGLMKKIQSEIPENVTIAEDKLGVLMYVLNCNSVYVLKNAYYHYRINQKSMVHSPNFDYLTCVNEVYKSFRNLYKHEKFTRTMRAQAEIYITELLMKGINSSLGFQIKNLLWIDPYWLESLPCKSRVVLYGSGELGAKYRLQLDSRKDLVYMGCIDFEYNKYQDEELEIQSPKILEDMKYDYIVITIKNPIIAEQITKRLIDFNVEESSILWFEQKEIFWKYVEADGLF